MACAGCHQPGPQSGAYLSQHSSLLQLDFSSMTVSQEQSLK